MVVTPLRRFWDGEQGVSAVELALILPFVLSLLLIMADLGFAVHQRMTMSHILRLGAESAMRGDDANEIADTLEAAVDNHATARMAALDVAAPREECRCPETGETDVDCTTTCAAGVAPDRYYQFSASLPYRSLLLGERLDITLRSRLRVQVPGAES